MESFGGRLLWMVISFSSGKDIEKLCQLLLPGCYQVIITTSNKNRSISPGRLSKEARRVVPPEKIRIITDPKVAMSTAFGEAGVNDLICVVGSVYLAGHAKSFFRAI